MRRDDTQRSLALHGEGWSDQADVDALPGQLGFNEQRECTTCAQPLEPATIAAGRCHECDEEIK